ncbi:hypothetical protein BD779DRAFT_1678858 [Infundibulicybe gibba]|nr:hypothetical protein BD779DRAFT_1678858 [Infundibulicybe gibba]
MPTDTTSQLEPSFEATWGAVVVLTWVSAASNGCIAMQACTYFHKFFHRDRSILKYMVAYIWFGCVTLVICEFWVMHDITIAGYSLPSSQVSISLGLPIGLAMGMTISCAVQIQPQQIFVGVLLRSGRDGAWGWIHMGDRVAHAVFAWQEAVLNEESKWIIVAFFAISVVLDIFIAGSTCYQLWRSRMIGLKRTRHLVDNLMRWTIRKSPPYLSRVSRLVTKDTFGRDWDTH